MLSIFSKVYTGPAKQYTTEQITASHQYICKLCSNNFLLLFFPLVDELLDISQPVTRTRLFINQYVVGLLLNLVPFVIMLVLMLLLIYIGLPHTMVKTSTQSVQSQRSHYRLPKTDCITIASATPPTVFFCGSPVCSDWLCDVFLLTTKAAGKFLSQSASHTYTIVYKSICCGPAAARAKIPLLPTTNN